MDNGSSDGSPDLVRDEFRWAHLEASRENLGFGRAVNRVAERTRTPWIAAANADVELMPGALEAMLAAGESDGSVGVVAPQLVMPGGETQHSVHPFPTVGLGIAYNLALHRLIPGLGDRLCLEGSWRSDRARDVDWAHGAFLLMRRRAFEAVGGFDPRQWMYAEDLDLGWRLAHSGWRTRYEPAARVRHEVGAAAREAFGDRRTERHLHAAYAWMLRRQGALRTRAYALVNLAGAAGRWLLYMPLVRLAPGRFARPAAAAQAYLRFHRVGLRRRRELLAVEVEASASR